MLLKHDKEVREFKGELNIVTEIKGNYKVELPGGGFGPPPPAYLSEVTFDSSSFIFLEDMYGKAKREYDAFMKTGKTRTILLYGPPGTGKTLFAKWLANENSEGLNISLDADSVDRYMALKEIRKANNRKILIVDEFERHEDDPNNWIKILDGVGEALENTFIIITTNHAEAMPPALLDRPGRIDRLIEVAGPTANDLRAYLETKVPKKEIDELSEDLLQFMSTLPLAYLNEIPTMREYYNLSCKEALEDLQERRMQIKKIYGR